MSQLASRFRDGLLATAAIVVSTILPGGRVWAGDPPAHSLNEFFDSSVLQRIDLRMDPAEWTLLHDKYLESTYYRCNFEWRGIVVASAGVKSRGTGSRNPIKPALGIDFSKFVSAQRFLGLKSIVLRNLAQDPTGAHEMVTEKMFARLGLPYSREAHVRLYVNDTYAGVYVLVEPFDERFLSTRFDESDGYLFEVTRTGDPYHFESLGSDPSLYVPAYFDPKTHSSNPDSAWLVNLIQLINSAPDSEFATSVGRYLDLEAFVTHLAVEQFMADWDGFLGELGMNNTYFYRRVKDRPALFLLWDKDGAMYGVDYSIWFNTNSNVLARRALAVPALRQRYMETIESAATAAGGPRGWMEQEFTRVVSLIHDSIREDPYLVCMHPDGYGPCTIAEVDALVDYTYQFLRGRSAFVRAELSSAGFTPAPRLLQPTAATNAASGEAVLVPGSLALLNAPIPFSDTPVQAPYPFPKELQGQQVMVAGQAAPIIRMAGQSILFQVPAEAPAGPMPIKFQSSGIAGNPLMVELRPARGGIFVATHADGTEITATHPASAGEIIVLYGTGFGKGKKDLATGEAAPLTELIELKQAITAIAGESPAEVLWAGLAPGYVGLHQIVLRLPDGLTSASRLTLTLASDGEPAVPFVLP